MQESRVYLRETTTVEASLLDEVTDDHLALWRATWQPAMRRHCAGRVPQDKPQDQHWDWQAKADDWLPLLGYHSFAIVCGGELQGLMLAKDEPGHFTGAVVSTRSVTGPSKPDSCRGSPFFHSRQLVNVKRPVGLAWPSPTHCGHSFSVPSA